MPVLHMLDNMTIDGKDRYISIFISIHCSWLIHSVFGPDQWMWNSGRNKSRRQNHFRALFKVGQTSWRTKQNVSYSCIADIPTNVTARCLASIVLTWFCQRRLVCISVLFSSRQAVQTILGIDIMFK